MSTSDPQVDVDSERAAVAPEMAPSPPLESEAAAAEAAVTEGAVAEAAIAETDGLAEAIGDGGAEEPEDDPEAQLREQAGRYLELAQRTQADFDNYRKRMTREVRAAEARGIGRLARELLPALDNLERALAAVETAEPAHQLSEGIRLVTKELSAALGRTGIEGYDPTGQPFDPNQHEAVAQHAVEGAESGTVVQVLQSGYRLNEAVLRPARVIVAS
ncbi:MAG: molecular chaperone GrpE [Solirubrobacteraceae bacterium]|nr:molecular chaperone GrpE [Solirubrobacteraceae bacterium]